jgi:hypothetical protein
MRLEFLDPVPLADRISAILHETFRPPHPCYTPDYLRWQFRAPGDGETGGLAAFEGEELVGFLGLMSRRLRFRGRRSEVNLTSFLSVRPDQRGLVAVALLRAMGQRFHEQKPPRPRLTFTVPGSLGDQMLQKVPVVQKLHQKPLGRYRTYAYPIGRDATPADPGPAVSCGEAADAGEFLAVAGRCSDPRTLWSDPDAAQLEHYRRDPRGCALAVARDARGEPVGAALAVHGDFVTAAGPERSPMLESVFLPEPSAAVLGALLRFASARWPARGGAGVVLAPNLWGVDSEVVRAAGLRPTFASSVAYLSAIQAEEPFLEAEGTNLEIT